MHKAPVSIDVDQNEAIVMRSTPEIQSKSRLTKLTNCST